MASIAPRNLEQFFTFTSDAAISNDLFVPPLYSALLSVCGVGSTTG